MPSNSEEYGALSWWLASQMVFFVSVTFAWVWQPVLWQPKKKWQKRNNRLGGYLLYNNNLQGNFFLLKINTTCEGKPATPVHRRPLHHGHSRTSRRSSVRVWNPSALLWSSYMLGRYAVSIMIGDVYRAAVCRLKTRNIKNACWEEIDLSPLTWKHRAFWFFSYRAIFLSVYKYIGVV